MSRKVYISSQPQYMRKLLLLFAVAALVLIAALFYELGQSRAGFSRISALEDAQRLEEENRELLRANKRLSEKVAVLETAAKIDKEAYSKVEAELVDLQSRILEQQENIEFYKGIVNENDGAGLRIQDFNVSQAFGEREFDLRLVLAQAFRSTQQVSGQVEVVVEGIRAGEAVRLKLGELSGSGETSDRIPYSFKYFQDLKAELVIPADFAPERVHVIVHPSGSKSKTVEDIFVWEVKQG